MSELVQIQYDMNCYDSCDSQTCLNMLKYVWTCSDHMIWIITIHVILKHVLTCSDSIWYKLLWFMWFSNMSELVQIQYDTNCYDSCDSQTCLNMLKHVWTCWNMSEPVETCLNLFRFNMIWIDAILKHFWTCSNMSKLVQIQYDTNCYGSCNFQTCLNMLKHA